MVPILLAALLPAAPAPLPKSNAELVILRLELEAHWSGKALVGLTEKEVRHRLGTPSSEKGGVLEYWESTPIEYMFVWVRMVQFKDGKTVSAGIIQRPVGCRYPGRQR